MAEPSDRVLDHLDSDDELFDELEREADQFTGFREQRLEQLKYELERARDMKENHHGTYIEIKDEKDILKLTTTTPRAVVHFFHKDFRRCAIIDKHLEILARKHFKTRFVRADVENVPFLVDRLKVKVLPCVIFFVDGVSKDRLIGFEELGNTDNFTTDMLEKRLYKADVIVRPSDAAAARMNNNHNSIFRFADGNGLDDESDDD
ncbi:hypothetical protein H9P43_005920 [Blastocladiella emersonii ATCC 22665]|nr:hypothetical protein H9P43_005920 [Blastocladiella emersonii ATCC 22665]